MKSAVGDEDCQDSQDMCPETLRERVPAAVCTEIPPPWGDYKNSWV